MLSYILFFRLQCYILQLTGPSENKIACDYLQDASEHRKLKKKKKQQQQQQKGTRVKELLSKLNRIYLFSCSVMPDSLWPHGLQHNRLPCLSPTLGACSNSCPSSWWCHPTISFSVIPFSPCLHSFPASGSFQMSQFFTSDGQSIGVSASALVLPMNIQDWFPLALTGWISLQSRGLSRVFSNTLFKNRVYRL